MNVRRIVLGLCALVLAASPDRLRVFLDYPGWPETRILDGAKGWRSDGQGRIAPGVTLTADLELSTGRIVRSTSALDMPGMKTAFVTEFADFRTVEGVLFPFRERNFASGQTTGETLVAKVSINPPLKDADFQP